MSTVKILVGDVRETLRSLPDQSVHCCVTSPPYWGLRNYGNDAQIGLEETPEEYVAQMVAVFREVRRVLRDDGTLWLNLGDSYAATSKGQGGKKNSTLNAKRDANGDLSDDRKSQPWMQDSRKFDLQQIGLKPKDLVGIPWRVAFALQADGWWLRQDIIWHKPNPMPESVTDRCTKSHEYVFLLTKSATYFYDAEAVKEAGTFEAGHRRRAFTSPRATAMGRNPSGNEKDGWVTESGFRNRRSVWTITTKPCKEAHFAVMPPDLAEPCILAGTSAEGCCAVCGAPWERVVERVLYQPEIVAEGGRHVDESRQDKTRKLSGKEYNEQARVTTTGWQPTCTCNAAKAPCTVLDPFGGAGTTGLVAQLHERNAILCELNPKYAKIAKRRIQGANPMFTSVEVVQ